MLIFNPFILSFVAEVAPLMRRIGRHDPDLRPAAAAGFLVGRAEHRGGQHARGRSRMVATASPLREMRGATLRSKCRCSSAICHH